MKVGVLLEFLLCNVVFCYIVFSARGSGGGGGVYSNVFYVTSVYCVCSQLRIGQF